jgi:hypothetical protein
MQRFKNRDKTDKKQKPKTEIRKIKNKKYSYREQTILSKTLLCIIGVQEDKKRNNGIKNIC